MPSDTTHLMMAPNLHIFRPDLPLLLWHHISNSIWLIPNTSWCVWSINMINHKLKIINFALASQAEHIPNWNYYYTIWLNLLLPIFPISKRHHHPPSGQINRNRESTSDSLLFLVTTFNCPKYHTSSHLFLLPRLTGPALLQAFITSLGYCSSVLTAPCWWHHILSQPDFFLQSQFKCERLSTQITRRET